MFAHSSAPDLNAEQRRAVEFRDGHLLVVAGAGTGKTRTLVTRVTSLIAEGVDPARILLLTFTRRSAAEMLGRVAAAGGAASSAHGPASQVWGGTFHSVANRLLRMYGNAAGLAPNFTVLDQSDSTDLMAMVRTEQGFGERSKRFPKATTVAGIYGRMVNSQAKLGEVLEADYPWCADHLDDLKTIFAAYTAAKRSHHVLDYDDLLLFWRGLLASPVGASMADLFDHILVDEYQDTNPIQSDILRGLTRAPGSTATAGPDRAGTQVCAVGDDAQAIYGFRSASVENMWAFTEHFPGASVVTLERNYRSTSPILQVANTVLSGNTVLSANTASVSTASVSTASVEGVPDASVPAPVAPRSTGTHFAKELWSARSEGPRPVLATHHDEGAQSRAVADAVLDARERGIDLRQQAVLFRAGHHGDSLELELTRRDIPYVKYGGLKYLEAAHVKDLLAMLRILENPSDSLAWHRVLGAIDGVGPATFRRVVSELGLGDGAPTTGDALDRFVDGEATVPPAATAQVTELRKAYADCRGEAMPPADQIARLTGFCALVFPNRYDNAAARLADVDQLAATAAGYRTRSRFLAELTLDPPGKTSEQAGPPHLDDDWLTLSTIHSAKGGEWRAVHLLHASDGNLPSDMATGDADGMAEELRLMYVALTRAKDELSVHVPLRYHVNRHAYDDRHLYAQASRFLEPARQLFEETTTDQDRTIDQVVASEGSVGVADEVDAMLSSLWD